VSWRFGFAPFFRRRRVARVFGADSILGFDGVTREDLSR